MTDAQDPAPAPIDLEEEQRRVAEFVRRGNFHAAYNIALSALNACRRDADQAGVDACIETIRDIVERLAQEYGSAGTARD